MSWLRHILICAASLLLLLGVPFFASGAYRAIAEQGIDAVSSASLIVDAPSGEYLILLNPARHTDPAKLEQWIDFFEEREVSYIFEDIVCAVAKGDAGGIRLAESYRSRLPENQMEIRQEDATLLLSKAEHGRYDIIILSREAAEVYQAKSVYDGGDTLVLRRMGE